MIRKVGGWGLGLLGCLLCCLFAARCSYVYLRFGGNVAASAIVVLFGLAALVGGSDYLRLNKQPGLEQLIPVLLRHFVAIAICMSLAIVFLESHPQAFYIGIGSGFVQFMTADPYYLGELHDAEIEKKKNGVYGGEQVVKQEQKNLNTTVKEEEQWSEERYRAFFHCDQIENGTLESYWKGYLDSRVGMGQPSQYKPDELSPVETNAISAIAEQEPFNQTVDDWKAQCAAHEDCQKLYPSATFTYYLSNDYHNLRECGQSAGASRNDLLLWCSNAVDYRLDYLTYREAAGVRDVVRWMGKRYEEIANDHKRFDTSTRRYARENADILLSMANEY